MIRAKPAAVAKAPQRRRGSVTPYLFISPFYLLFGVFFLLPTLAALVLSFFRWSSMGAPSFFGVSNYERLFLNDPVFWQAIINTLVYSAASIFIICPLALLLALALNSQDLWFKTFWRTVYFAPIVTSTVAVSLVFVMFYNKDYGLFNGVLGFFGLEPVNWLGDRSKVKLAVVGVVMWRWTGLTSIYFLAGLQGIARVLYEAAKIDGANTWQRFWHITLPQLRPVTLFVIIIVVIGSLQTFDEPQILTGGGPANASLSVVQYLYSRGIEQLRFGYASAIGVLLFISIFVLSFLQFRLFRVGNG